MQLVFLSLEMIEEPAQAEKSSVTAQHQTLVLCVEIAPGHIERDARLLGVALEIGKQRAIFRLRPRLDRTLGQRLHLVWNDKAEIKVDRVAKSLAARACAIRVVKREQPRLRFLVPYVAVLALEALGKTQRKPGRPGSRLIGATWNFKDHFARFAIRGLNRVDQARANIRSDDDPVYQNEDGLRKIKIEQRLGRREFEDLPALIKTIESSLAQIKQPGL
jgi:hypothetical protein